ncbi:putative transcription factor bHLH041 isoform X2 [Brachypodium distachyon]|uniref:putative transcription factor bHLH041 isoform X2 n=1 Tax=Brachypodium distachyon TaxID=15368 RepID=UPI00071DFF04|nr:putative transcription factor bHLH041 isoform X2 [Brachypodium distachyon]|eukprot:XP_014756153.1 putative transcription factor bHLH041 isoform X2 [Brachypodium distachyon]
MHTHISAPGRMCIYIPTDPAMDRRRHLTTNQQISIIHGRRGDLSPPCCSGNDMMDTLFVLGQESRLRILQQAAARVPGCAYICVWAPINPGAAQQQQLLLPPPPLSSARSRGHLLCCLDAWLRGDVGDRGRALFQAYRGSLCGVESGCVPGWAFREGRSYMELPEHDLAASASLPLQLQFYQEAGIEMAAFVGCESGEIEMGVSAPTNNLRASVEQVFSEDFFQQSLLEELLQLPPTRPSSSSSSIPSISVGSPAADGASTSLPRSTATTMAMPMAASSATPSPRDLSLAQQPLLHPLFSRHAAYGHGQFPSAEADDAAMAQAMLAVISSSSSPSSSSMPAFFGTRRGAHRGSSTTTTAFRAYNAALAPRRAPGLGAAAGQRMIKRGISILRRMHVLKCGYGQNHQDQQRAAAGAAVQRRRDEVEEEEAAQPPAPSSSQLHHMISERRRRERLNESFEALRGLLPPGSKNDKATVLANTLEYMNILITQIADLESKNRALEAAAQVYRPIVNGSSSRESRRPDQALVQQGLLVEVSTSSGAGASTSSTPVSREVTIRVAAPGGDLSELVTRVLRLLKETGHRFTVVAVDASRHPAAGGGGIAQASMTLRATAAGELDEASLREAVAKAVEGLVTPSDDDDESP